MLAFKTAALLGFAVAHSLSEDSFHSVEEVEGSGTI